MPRPKKPQEFYGLHLAIFPDLAKYIEDKGYNFDFPSNPALRHPNARSMPGLKVQLSREELLDLVRVAKRPESSEAREAFGKLFAKWPDEVLDIVRFIRQKLTSVAQSDRVTIYLRTNKTTVQDGEIAQQLTPAGIKPGHALNVSPDSVKKARAKMRRLDEILFLLSEHPIAQEYAKTGTKAARDRLMELLESRLKGKK